MKYIIILFALFKCLNLLGQDFTNENSKNNTFRMISGIGYTAIRYEYYDKDRYSGGIKVFGIEYERQARKSLWKIYGMINYGKIKTEIDDAKIINGSLGYDLHFPIYNFTVFRNETNLFIGPSIFFGAYIREQNKIALYNIVSGIVTASVGSNIALTSYLTERLHFSTALRFALISFVEQEGQEYGFVGIQKALFSTNFFSLNWQIHQNINLGIKYQFNYLNFRKWTSFVSGSDLLLFSFNLNL